MKIGVIIEARMCSTRLPGKVLLKVKNKTMLEMIIDRINLIKKIKTTIVATTTNKNDDKIVKWCKTKKIDYFRGSEENVLNRVYLTAKKFKLALSKLSNCFANLLSSNSLTNLCQSPVSTIIKYPPCIVIYSRKARTPDTAYHKKSSSS